MSDTNSDHIQFDQTDQLNLETSAEDEIDSPAPPPWQLIDLQDCLHDSPQFRRMLGMKEKELTDLERKLEKVVTSCSAMVETGQVYRESCRLFSLSLKELSDHFNELPIVQDAYQKFCEIFNEIQTYYRILFDQAQRTVMKGLKEFLTGELKKVHNSKKSFHKTSAELSYVTQKNATASKQKPTEAEEMSLLLQNSQVDFTHQALDYCYQINVVSCLKSHRIMEKLVSFLSATSFFFHQGFDSLKLIDPFLRKVIKEMDELQTQSNTDINYMRDRHSLVSTQHLQDDSPEVPTDSVSIPIVFRGYLFKRSHNAFKSWNRRYCELRDSKLYYLKKDSENDYGIIADDLRLCTVKIPDDLERRFCFEVVTPNRSCMLQADSDADKKKWCMYLEAGIARALRITCSNKSRETRRRLTSVAPVTTYQIDQRYDSPSSLQRSETPSSLNSNVSCSFDFLDVPGNDICADCSRPNPKWASLNIGIVLCIDCSGIHRSLGVHISKVRSITLDDWEPDHQKIMCLLGNDRVNSIFEFEVPSYVKKPTSTTSSSDREEYIRLKYVSRAFVHTHPDFNRPEVPVPPTRIQGTLLRAAATSPKLVGRLNRPMSMAIGLENHLSPTRSPLPSSSMSSNQPHSGESSPLPFGGMNLRPESMALLEENWKKLEKNGRLQQWNLKSMYNVVKSQKKSFSLSKFTRPGSFRRKTSAIATDDYPHSDNELDDSLTTTYLQTHLMFPPRKPPRTYKTTHAEVYSRGSKSLFNPEGDDFSSDLMSTFERLGSVYSISGLLGEETDTNELNNADKTQSHNKIKRSVSSIAEFSHTIQPVSNEAMSIPTINVVPNASFDNDDLIEEDESDVIDSRRSSLQKEISRSVGSIPNLVEGISLDHLNDTPTHDIIINDSPDDGSNEEDDKIDTDIDNIKDRTLKHIDFSQYVPDDDDSSVDSYQSAEDRNEFISRHRSSSPPELSRPDSSASELFHTPPNSLSPSPTGLESISPSQITNIGLALGVNITLEDSQSTLKRRPDGGHKQNITDLTLLVDLNDENIDDDEDLHVSRFVSAISSVDGQTNNRIDITPEIIDSVFVSNGDGASVSRDNVTSDVTGDVNVDLVSSEATPATLSPDQELPDNNETGDAATGTELDKLPSDAVFHSDQYTEYDIHIIPEDISPSKFIYECSLNGDLGGILSGVAHGGVVNTSNAEEGNKYPIHQACITGNETVVEYLYQNGAKVNVFDNRGCTPLHLSSMNGYASLVAVLVRRGANCSSQDEEGKDPLTYAEERGNNDIVTMLQDAKSEEKMKYESIHGKQTTDDTVTDKEQSETDSERIKTRSVSSTNSSSSLTDRVTSGSELSMSSTSTNNKPSGLLNSISKPDT